MTHILEDFQEFLNHSPTSWHATEEMGNRLALKDYIPLVENEKWQLEKGKRYFVTRGGSLCCFILPNSSPKRCKILTAHTDSPALKLKPIPEFKKENMTLLGVETYGGPILASWMGRDLAIAGRVVIETADHRLEEKHVWLDDAPLIIPFLAIHLDREVNEKGLLINKQDHLVPLATLKNESLKQSYLEYLLRRQFSFNALMGFDLFLIPIENSRFLGSEGEMISSYRLDNLESVHAALVAFGSDPMAQKDTLQMGIFWDHEEIGSVSETGAESSFFEDIWTRIAAFYKLSSEDIVLIKQNSLCLSLDVAHAFHPNYPQKYDPNHQPLMNKGIVLKYNANLRYASNALGASQIMQLCQQSKIHYQSFVYRSDQPGGSTVGPLFAKKWGINTVDMGVPLLSMHATREVIACQDHVDLCQLLTHFLKNE